MCGVGRAEAWLNPCRGEEFCRLNYILTVLALFLGEGDVDAEVSVLLLEFRYHC